MTNQKKINAFYTAAAALLTLENPTPQQQELITLVSDVFEDPMTAPLQKPALEKNLIVVTNKGVEPTVNGWDALFGENTKTVVKRMAPKNMSDKAVVETFLTSAQEICFRTKHVEKFPEFTTQLNKNIKPVVNAYNCVGETIGNLLGVEA